MMWPHDANCDVVDWIQTKLFFASSSVCAKEESAFSGQQTCHA